MFSARSTRCFSANPGIIKKLHVERLEERMVMSATADIVFVIDESNSNIFKTIGNNDVAFMHEWAANLAISLDTKLVSRGIDNNRFFLTGFGGEYGDVDALVDSPRNTDAPRTVDLDNNPQACTIKRWGTAQEFATSILMTDSLQSNYVLAGGEEDGWWGIYMAAEGEIGVRTGSQAFSPVCAGESADTDGFVNTPYKFRKNAAVHFVLISDEPDTVSLRAPNGPFVRNLNEMLAVLSMASLTDTNNAPNKISNAVVTAIVPALFTDIKNTNIGGNPAIADPIMGIDADVFDNWDVDRNQASSTNHQAHVFVHKPTTNKVNVITTTADILDFYGHGPGNSIVTKPANYQTDLLNRVLADPSVPYLGDINAVPIQHIAQRRFFSERYAFLAWETGGTVWDIDFAIGKVHRGASGTGSVWLPDEI
jgi:hypothetical protein